MNWCELGMWRLENKILKIKRHVLSFFIFLKKLNMCCLFYFFEKIKTVWKHTVLRIIHELHQVEAFFE